MYIVTLQLGLHYQLRSHVGYFSAFPVHSSCSALYFFAGQPTVPEPGLAIWVLGWRGHLTNPGQSELGGKHEQIGAYLPSPPIHRQPRSGAFAAVILTQYGGILPPKEHKEILIAQHGPARGNAEEALGGA